MTFENFYQAGGAGLAAFGAAAMLVVTGDAPLPRTRDRASWTLLPPPPPLYSCQHHLASKDEAHHLAPQHADD